ncbi:MAG: class I SAM-dependent rRNA methyltransferase [Bacteroidota bacterium]
MSQKHTIILKKGKDEAIRRFHPWIFSGAIHKIIGEPEEGDLVNVLSANQEWLALGHYGSESIAVRIISFDNIEINQEFWKNKINNAFEARKKCGLVNNKKTNAFRLIFGEGDGVPGLIIDIYHQTAVIQCHTLGIFNAVNDIAIALDSISELKLECIYNKSSSTLGKQSKQKVEDAFIKGSLTSQIITENEHQFLVDWVDGQKTGFFLDQRDNRQLLSRFAKDKTVLNAYCYSGGFSIYALKAGAKAVHSVDASQKAITLTEKNLELNNFSSDNNPVILEDVRTYLQNCPMFDVIILDPPAFAKHHSEKAQAIKGYRNINAMAIKKLNKGGVLFTFSCSQAMDRNLFQSTVVSAAILAGRQCRILHHLDQGADHPLNAFYPEGTYLKGLALVFD